MISGPLVGDGVRTGSTEEFDDEVSGEDSFIPRLYFGLSDGTTGAACSLRFRRFLLSEERGDGDRRRRDDGKSISEDEE